MKSQRPSSWHVLLPGPLKNLCQSFIGQTEDGLWPHPKCERNPTLSATNNRAERSLRPAVIVRKTGGCNKTKVGADTHSILASVLVTARQRGIDGIAYVARLLTAPDGKTPTLLTVPINTS